MRVWILFLKSPDDVRIARKFSGKFFQLILRRPSFRYSFWNSGFLTLSLRYELDCQQNPQVPALTRLRLLRNFRH